MDILSHPNPVLKRPATRVEPGTDKRLQKLVDEMTEAMYEAPGVGLAATQLGVCKRVFVFDLDEGLTVVCNPAIVESSEETEVDEEGCLSLPGITVPVERAARVVCEGVDLDGAPVRLEGTGLLARLFQHEIDHLDGVLIIDRAKPEDRKEALRRYREIHAE